MLLVVTHVNGSSLAVHSYALVGCRDYRRTQAHLTLYRERAQVSGSSGSRLGSDGNTLWILKPAGLWGGQRIEMEHALDLPAWIEDRHRKVTNARTRDRFGLTWVVQKYVEDPLCLDRAAVGETATSTDAVTRHQVDFRLFVFVSKEGVFCAKPFLGRVSPMAFTDLTQRRRGSGSGSGGGGETVAAGAATDDETRNEDVKAHLTNTCVLRSNHPLLFGLYRQCLSHACAPVDGK